MPNEALEVALRLLSRREHSRKELRNKLKQRGFDSALIDDVLDVCQMRGFQSDIRFSEMLCRARIERGYGPLVIRALLQQAGVSREIISDLLTEMDSVVVWADEVARVRHKKFGVVSKMSYETRQKQKKFLQYRGFTEVMIEAHFETLCATKH